MSSWSSRTNRIIALKGKLYRTNSSPLQHFVWDRRSANFGCYFRRWFPVLSRLLALHFPFVFPCWNPFWLSLLTTYLAASTPNIRAKFTVRSHVQIIRPWFDCQIRFLVNFNELFWWGVSGDASFCFNWSAAWPRSQTLWWGVISLQIFRSKKFGLYFCEDSTALSELIGYVDLTDFNETWPKRSLVIYKCVRLF